MDILEQIISQYGPAVIFVGTFLEGETLVVVAGFLSHQGIISPLAVSFSAFAGSFLGDQLWFYLGRRHASHPLILRLTRRPGFKRVAVAIEDHPKKFILSFRFIYGIRTISPVALALTSISGRQFLILNAIAAAIWAIAFTALGYVFGQAAEALLGEIKAIERKILLAGVIGFGVVTLYYASRRISRARKNRPDR